MSKLWWIVFGVALGLGCVAIAVGIKLSGLDSFIENVLPGAGVSLIVFAFVVLLIEGPVMTRERRLQKVVRKACRDVTQINGEIAITLVREIGEDLASRLDSNINLYGDERGNWKDFKDLLRKVFKDARQVSVRGLPRSGSISKEDYLSYVEAARKFMEQVGSAIGNDWEVKAELQELIEHRNRLGKHIIEADYPYIIEDEKNRYEKLAVIGEGIIDLIERCPRIKE
jgi:hypothetical protein